MLHDAAVVRARERARLASREAVAILALQEMLGGSMLKRVVQYWPTPFKTDFTRFVGNVMFINGVAVGSAPNQRTNRIIRMLAVEVFIVYAAGQDSTGALTDGATAAARVICAIDEAHNNASGWPGSYILAADTFYAPNSSEFDDADVHRPMIVFDDLCPGFGIMPGTHGRVPAESPNFVFRRIQKLNHKTVFSSGGANDTDVVTGAMYLACWQDGHVFQQFYSVQEAYTSVYYVDE